MRTTWLDYGSCGALVLAVACSNGVDGAPDKVETPEAPVEQLDDDAGDTDLPPGETGLVDALSFNGVLDTSGDVDVLHLWGTRSEIGYAEGALLCGRVTQLFEDYVLDYQVAGSGYDWSTLSDAAMDRIAVPEGDRAELEGIIDGITENCGVEALTVHSDHLGLGSGGSRALTLDDLILANALGDWACSSFTVWGSASASGSTLHGRNFDYSSDPGGTFLAQHLIKVIQSEDEGADFVSISTPGLVGCISCFTEGGIGLTMHNVSAPTTEYASGFVPRTWAMRAALVAAEASEDPIQAVDAVLEDAPQYRGNGLHLSVPCAGSDCVGGSVFEYDGQRSHSDGQSTIRGPGSHASTLGSSHATVATNHYLKRQSPLSSGDSVSRYESLAAAIDASNDGVDVGKASEMLAAVAASNTAHSVVVHEGRLSVWVSRQVSKPATDFEPTVIVLGDIFGVYP